MKPTTSLLAALVAAAIATPACLAQTDEHAQITSSSQQFRNGAAAAIKDLLAGGFEDELESPALGSADNDDYKALLAAITREPRIADIDQADPGAVYDVILQPGHYFRLTGNTGASGRKISERALVNFITTAAADELRKRKLKVAVVSADTPFRDKAHTAGFEGLTGRIFLAIHADGSTAECRTGPSLAYQTNSSVHAMHAIGWALSQALGYTYQDFMKDNFTVNEAKYYMFKHVRTPLMTGLLEVGEITCEKAEERLIGGARRAGHNIAHALDFVLKASR